MPKHGYKKSPNGQRCTPHEYYLRYKETRRKYREANKERVADKAREWARNNPEQRRAIALRWRTKNPEKYKALHAYDKRKETKKEWRARNSAKWAARAKAWRMLNKPRRAAYEAQRRVEKRLQVIASATPAFIQYFYDWAEHMTKKTGVPHEVDHMVPLRGKNVCGLHAEWNLRVIPARENREKKNALVEELASIQNGQITGVDSIPMDEMERRFG